jgi:hypothetical protein
VRGNPGDLRPDSGEVVPTRRLNLAGRNSTGAPFGRTTQVDWCTLQVSARRLTSRPVPQSGARLRSQAVRLWMTHPHSHEGKRECVAQSPNIAEL